MDGLATVQPCAKLSVRKYFIQAELLAQELLSSSLRRVKRGKLQAGAGKTRARRHSLS